MQRNQGVSVNVAHEYPVTGPEALPSVSGIIREISGLVTPPGVHLRLLETIQAPEASIADIGALMAQDPSLTVRLLRLVNSSFYGFAARIDTVTRAISLIGLRELHSLVAAVSVVSSFSRISLSLVNMDTFWRHSLFTALLAKRIAREAGVLHAERLFVAGLLHDLGSLVLYHRMPSLMRDLLLIAAGDEQALYQAETGQLGFNHAQLGALLLEIWNLPAPMREAVKWHHAPEQAEAARREAAIVHLAEALANRSELGAFCERPDTAPPFDQGVWSMVGLDPEAFDPQARIGEAGLEFTGLAAALTGRA